MRRKGWWERVIDVIGKEGEDWWERVIGVIEEGQ